MGTLQGNGEERVQSSGPDEDDSATITFTLRFLSLDRSGLLKQAAKEE